MKVLVTGSGGLIGGRLLELLTGFDMIATELTKDARIIAMDITDQTAVAAALYDHRPDWVIHLAAFTDVEKAETQRQLAWSLNVEATRNLAQAAADNQSRLLYLSTGFVFDGLKPFYTEEDDTHPINYYGESKLAGEEVIRKIGLPHIILRITFPFRTRWPKKTDIVRLLAEKLLNKQPLSLVVDQYLTPIFIDDIIESIKVLITQEKQGLYHLGSDSLSFVALGEKIAQVFEIDKPVLNKVTLAEFMKQNNKQAKQPAYNCLSSQKLSTQTGVKIRSVEEALKKVRESYL